MAYATVAELQAGWMTLSATEQAIATELLDRASKLIDIELEKRHTRASWLVEPYRSALKIACCDMVRYAFYTGNLGNSGLVGDSYDSVQMRTDMYGGNIKVNDDILKMLGFGKSHACFAGVRHG